MEKKLVDLRKYKVFTLEDMKKAILWAHDKSTEGVYLSRLPIDEYLESLQQPTEIEVVIERQCLDPNCDGVNRKGCCIPGDKPKLDSSGNLILKKI